jgi:uncharacterized protein YbjT (DUF2867 family)
MHEILSWACRTVKIMTILVTGATGNIGRRIVDHLIGLSANDIRALKQTPLKAADPSTVTSVTAWTDRHTCNAARQRLSPLTAW